MLQHKAHHLRQVVAHPLEVAFELQIVREVELTNARRIAATAQVFEQQGVVELPELVFIQTDFTPNVHADPAAPDAVPLRLPFGDVERITQRADQFRQFEVRPDGAKSGRVSEVHRRTRQSDF